MNHHAHWRISVSEKWSLMWAQVSHPSMLPSKGEVLTMWRCWYRMEPTSKPKPTAPSSSGIQDWAFILVSKHISKLHFAVVWLKSLVFNRRASFVSGCLHKSAGNSFLPDGKPSPAGRRGGPGLARKHRVAHAGGDCGWHHGQHGHDRGDLRPDPHSALQEWGKNSPAGSHREQPGTDSAEARSQVRQDWSMPHFYSLPFLFMPTCVRPPPPPPQVMLLYLLFGLVEPEGQPPSSVASATWSFLLFPLLLGSCFGTSSIGKSQMKGWGRCPGSSQSGCTARSAPRCTTPAPSTRTNRFRCWKSSSLGMTFQ